MSLILKVAAGIVLGGAILIAAFTAFAVLADDEPRHRLGWVSLDCNASVMSERDTQVPCNGEVRNIGTTVFAPVIHVAYASGATDESSPTEPATILPGATAKFVIRLRLDEPGDISEWFTAGDSSTKYTIEGEPQ